jgi:hypothetical protein
MAVWYFVYRKEIILLDGERWACYSGLSSLTSAFAKASARLAAVRSLGSVGSTGQRSFRKGSGRKNMLSAKRTRFAMS